ncbi:MAG: hypothetical protein DCF32_14960 [Leptolyngbya sp.]|nr:MAG: hypothetical protein DCF32_14960 [Leptolyngbya sp.]
MSNPPPTVLQLARQGDPEAIAALMNRHLEAQGITAHVVQHASTLQVNLEAAQVPNQADLVAYVKKGITGLELATVQQLTVSGKQLGADASAWSENLVLQDPSIDALDFDLGLDVAPASDDLDLNDLSFDAALGDDFSGAGLDLELTDSPSDLDLDSPADFDLSFTDSASDFDLDLTDTGLTAPGADLEAADDFSLAFTDTPTDAGDLDFDLGLGEVSSEPTAADLDFDLGLPDSAAADVADFDLDLAASAADLSATEASLVENADITGLDFDLGFEEAPAGAEDDLSFDLGLIDAPAENVPDRDFDLDLAMDDLALGDEVAEAAASDLDLGPAPSPTEEPFTTDALDLDFGLEDASTGADDELDFDLGTDASGLDLDFAAADQAALDLEAQQWAVDSSPEAVADFDLDFESGPELGEMVEDQAAIAADDLDFDLNAPAPPPTVPDVDPDLDDLWSSSDASPDLGVTPIADPAASSAAPWADDLSGMDDLIGFDEDLSSDAVLSDDFPNLESSPNDLDFPEIELDPLAATEFDTGLDLGLDSPSDLDFPEIESDPLAATKFDTGLDLGLDEGFDPDAPLFADSTFDADAFPDLDLGTDSTASNLEAGSEPLPPELLTPEELAFEDLDAAANLDLAEPSAFADSDWSTDEPDLTLDSDTDLGTYDELGTYDDLGTAGLAESELPLDSDTDLGTYDDLGSYDDLGTADFAAVDLDLAEGELSDQAIDTPLSSDFDLEAGSDDLVLEPLGVDAFVPEEGDLDFSAADAPPWAAEDSSFDPNLVLDSPADFGAEPESIFDPGLTFDAQAEDPYTTPNPFAAEPYGTGFESDADMPFSTMELDQTVEGDFMPDLAMANELSGDDAAFLEQPEDYSAGSIPAADLGLSDDISNDPAFESVEFGNNEFEAPSFEAAGLSDESLDTDFGSEGFDDEGFESAGFDDEGFDDGAFSDSSIDSNGFIQDHNGVALADDEPDATDDFIQEFGSDPSTHVSLTPDQFNDDGSVRRSGGGSGLPMRLILGLGLGALALALVGLLLNGLLGRLRPPTPGGEPAITEPAVPPPVDPATVPAEDLFRQAVNAAQTAANQAQTASTPAQWQEVANAWAQAIALMQRVPASDPNYATAQQKAVDYQPNLDYARQNAQ